LSDLKSILPPSVTPEGRKLSGRQVGQYRRWATIALDTNVLLNLYAYSRRTREEFLGILGALETRLWLPHQTAVEYARLRAGTIQSHVEFSEGIRALLTCIPEDFRKNAEKKHPRVGRKAQYPFRPVKQMEEELVVVTERIAKELLADEKEYEGFLVKDPIQDRLSLITHDRIGIPLSSADLQQVYENGRTRYDLERPPGYRDATKPGAVKYGDLVLWEQLILRARETGHAIYFVTDDTKEDWWQRTGEEVSGPRSELVEEMGDRASQMFLISTSADFYDWAGDCLGRRARRAAIEEARQLAMPVKWDAVSDMLRDTQRAIQKTLSIPYLPDYLERFRETMAAAGGGAQLQLAAFAEELSRSVSAAASLPSLLPFLEALRLGKSEGSASDAGAVEEQPEE
jgi:uncharacterized membrane protein